MNKSQKIYFNTTKTGTDMNMMVRLEQDIDTLEFMSMQLSTEEIYQDFNSDYGVLVGKVTANGGVGIPNAKISIFIPLSDADATDGQITSIYPYTTPRDKNLEGKRYNLLPRVSKVNPITNQLTPKQPFGSFPIKEEVVTNMLIMDVYKKYYKYTALTNDAGDYMIFGVPTGTQTVHMSVDITDIGEYSMNPAAMVVNLGYSPNLFTDNNTKIKPSTDLGDLPNIETQEISVDIIPFWGDTTNFTIGITRQDFRIRATLINTFTIFGSAFTDSIDTLWGNSQGIQKNRGIYGLYSAPDLSEKYIGMANKRSAKITEKIYYYPAEISDEDINNNAAKADPTNMKILDSSEYSTYKKNGDFVLIINANRNKITKDDSGHDIKLNYDSPDGIFTEFRGFATFEINIDDANIDAGGTTHPVAGNKFTLSGYRYKFKFPQYADSGKGFGHEINDIYKANNDTWRRQNFTFKAGKYYSVARFHGTTFNDAENNIDDMLNPYGFVEADAINFASNNGGRNADRNVGIILTSDVADTINSTAQFPSNAVVDTYQLSNPSNVFGANWINFTIYFPQSGYVEDGYSYYTANNRTADNFQTQFTYEISTAYSDFFLQDNNMIIAATDKNTKWFARSDLHWTDFVEIPIADLVELGKYDKGYKYNPDNYNLNSLPIRGKYRSGRLDSVPDGWNAPCPLVNGEDFSKGGILDGYPHVAQPTNPLTGIYPPDNPVDPNIYFYRGVGNADCIKFLKDLGLIN